MVSLSLSEEGGTGGSEVRFSLQHDVLFSTTRAKRVSIAHAECLCFSNGTPSGKSHIITSVLSATLDN